MGYWSLEEKILEFAKMSGCDLDGDYIIFKGKHYYVHIFDKTVKYIGEVKLPEQISMRFPVY